MERLTPEQQEQQDQERRRQSRAEYGERCAYCGDRLPSDPLYFSDLCPDCRRRRYG